MENFNMPLDTDLYFIAYGIFRPGDISYLLINKYVDKFEQITLKGTIRIRDGVKIYSNKGQENVEAFLIKFKDNESRKAYEYISKKEPENLFDWGVIEYEGIKCNLLIAKNINNGSISLLEAKEQGNDFWTIDQPYWENAFKFLKDQILNLIDEESLVGEKVCFVNLKIQQKNNSVLFTIQQNYLLLWSMVERFCYYRFHDKKSTDRIEQMFSDFSASLSTLKEVQSEIDQFKLMPAKIYNSQSLRMSSKIVDDKINFYFFYCLRNNMIHSMKTINNDVPRAFYSLIELYFLFKNYFIKTKNECLTYRDYE